MSTRKRRRTRHPFRGLLLFLLTLGAAALFLHWSNTAIQTTRFDPVFADLPEGFDGCRILVLGDLHGTDFGENNEKLLSAAEEADPDYIFLVGDLLDAFRENPENYADRTAAALSAVAPTCYVTGNHEWGIGNVPALKETLEENGVTVLTNRYVLLQRDGDTVVLAGIDDPNGYADQKSPEEVAATVYAEQGDAFWMLLAHRNNLFENHYSLLGADLVISAHGHGGLIRLPFTDGLVSTEHTFFPSYTAGLYEKNDSTLFVTRGLGNSGSTFRLFNRPEAALLTLHKG